MVKYVSTALPGSTHSSNISDISSIWTGNVLEWSAFEYIYSIGLGGDAVATAWVVRWDERKFKIKRANKTERDGRRKVRGDRPWMVDQRRVVRQWMDTGD